MLTEDGPQQLKHLNGWQCAFPLASHTKENETPCAGGEKTGFTFTGCFNENHFERSSSYVSYKAPEESSSVSRPEPLPLQRPGLGVHSATPRPLPGSVLLQVQAHGAPSQQRQPSRLPRLDPHSGIVSRALGGGGRWNDKGAGTRGGQYRRLTFTGRGEYSSS